MKVNLRTVALAVAAVTALAGSAPVDAEDDKRTIDCSTTDLEFTGERFEVECIEFDNEQIHHNEGSAQVQIEMLWANSNQTADWLTAIDFRILGSLAIRRVGLEENVRSYFKDLPLKDWKSVGDVEGYEAAEFVSDGSDDIQDCVAFQSFFNRRYNGFSSWLVGVACSSDGKEAAYKTLAGFSGPGG